MPELTLFEPPLSSIPDGYDWEERSVSQLSTTTTFRAGLDQRDTFLGVARCVVCGFSDSDVLEHCYIISPKSYTVSRVVGGVNFQG